MPNPSKQKGDRFERLLVKTLREAGIDAGKVPLSGAVEGFPGDVMIEDMNPALVCQCKHFAGSFKNLFTLAEKERFTIIFQPQSPTKVYLLLMLPVFLDWWRAGAPRLPADVRCVSTWFQQCADWLVLEDALFVKRDRGPVFVVLPIDTVKKIIEHHEGKR